ncbi:serine hydrolase [Caldilinea sp.]|uniref:serine hydrolase domain-containing protein n=1 Tax=Caldilinea sp. TaxID=2293560 RepID=UPI002B94CCE8|nr:serine hydrolase [Anaerolineales bacterium]HQY95273.1 serine hydrolase [Caldilinea sp.]
MHHDPRLPHCTPEAQGVASAAILAFLDAVARDGVGLHSLMLVRHGHVIADGWWAPYAPELLHMLFSLSKSFVSTAIGLAVTEGRLSVDDPVLRLFPEEAPPVVSDALAAMRVRHLLTMSTGHDADVTQGTTAAPDGNWVKAFLAQPVQHQPGTHFAYNSAATYMLSAIVQRLTGETVLAYLGPRLLKPLGIEGATWQSCPRGVNVGGWGLNLRTEDIACFGQLYLQQGEWQGRQLIPTAWVQEATAWQVSNGADPRSDWAQGYGYQFWRCRHHAYRGDGAFGQFCLVIPDQGAVVAMTAGEQDMQRMLNLVWAHLLPAMHSAPLAEDAVAAATLKQRLASLVLPPVSGAQASPAAMQVSGRRYSFRPNQQQIKEMSLTFVENGCELVITDRFGEHRIVCGYGEWRRGATRLESGELQRVAVSGAWTDVDTFTIQLAYNATPFCPRITCRFDNDRLHYQYVANVAFGRRARPQLVGRRSG